MNENPTRNQEQMRIDTEYVRNRMTKEEWQEQTEELSNSRKWNAQGRISEKAE